MIWNVFLFFFCVLFVLVVSLASIGQESGFGLLVGVVGGSLLDLPEKGCGREEADKDKGEAGAEDDPLVLGDPGHVKAKQGGAGDQVHRHPEPVHDVGPVTLGDDLALDKGHGREVHPDGHLQQEEAGVGEEYVEHGGFGSGREAAHSHRDAHDQEADAENVLRAVVPAQQERVDGGADHDGHHEAGEDHSQRGVGRHQHRRPQEHEDVHAGLHHGLDGAQEEDLPVSEDVLESVHAGGHQFVLAVPVVLGPGLEHQHPAQDQREDGHYEGGHGAEAQTLGREVGDHARHDGQHTVPEGGGGEGDADPLCRKAVVLRVLVDVPGLEGGEQHGCGDPAQDAAQHKHPVVGTEFGQAAEGVHDAEEERDLPAADHVSQRPGGGAEHDTAGESGHVEHRDLGLPEAIVVVEFVDVGALEPVT